MLHPVAITDYALWILQALITLIFSVVVYRRLSILEVNEGLMKILVILIMAESICTLLFEPMFALGANSKAKVFVSSVAIGGEVSLKALALCLFAFKYYSACIETP